MRVAVNGNQCSYWGSGAVAQRSPLIDRVYEARVLE
jgi:hypothetical protein